MGFWDAATMWYRPSTYGVGSGSGGTKAARRQADVANQTQQAQAILDQLLSQLLPGSEEYQRLLAEGLAYVQRVSQGIPWSPGELTGLAQPYLAQHNARIAAGGAATPFEARTDTAFKGYREASAPVPFEQDILDALAGGQPIDTPTGQISADIIARAQNPDAYYTSTLNPALKLAEDAVKARAAQRGIVGSGLELEDFGRTGAELAIREAAQKEQFRQQGLANFGTIYDFGEGLRERGIGVERDLVNLQLGREGRSQDIISGRTGIAEGRTAGVRADQAGLARGDLDYERALARQREEDLMKLLTEGGKLAASAATGIPFSALPTGSPATFTPTGGSAAPIGVEETLALQRSGFGGQMNVNKRRLSDLLTRY